MSSDRLRAYVELSRPVNVFITLVSIAAASVLAGAKPSDWLLVLLASLTGALVAAGANAINDYFDLDIDLVNRPDRPIPSGALSKGQAKTFWLFLSAAGILTNLFINQWAFVIVLGSVVVLYEYSARLKRTVLLGNIVVGVMTGMAFIYGGVVVGNPERSVVPALFAFLINVAREIVKDVQDLEGDKKEQAATLPVRYGVKPALWFASLTILFLIVAMTVVYALHVYSAIFLYLAAFISAILLYVLISMWKNHHPSNMNKISTALKVCMMVGLLAIYFGS